MAVCCSVLQCVAVYCSVLQCGRALLQTSTDVLGSLSLCCSMLQCVAVCCSVLQRVAACRSSFAREAHTLQHAATRCNTLQHAAIRCNTLQHNDGLPEICMFARLQMSLAKLGRFIKRDSPFRPYWLTSRCRPYWNDLATATCCNMLQHAAMRCNAQQLCKRVLHFRQPLRRCHPILRGKHKRRGLFSQKSPILLQYIALYSLEASGDLHI